MIKNIVIEVISILILFSICSAQDKIDMNTKYIKAKIRVVSNLKDIKSLIQTASDYLKDCHDTLIKSREIAIKGSNGIYTPKDRENMISDLITNIENYNRIISKATFNNMNIFFDNEQRYHSFKVTYSEMEEPEIFTIAAPNFEGNKNILDIMTNDLKPTPEYFDKLISKIDIAFNVLYYERSKLNSEENRIDYAIGFQYIFIQDQTNTNNIIENLKKHYNLIEDKIYGLAIQSSSGIYTSIDRACIDFDFQKLINELNLEEKICGLKTELSFGNDDNLLTQEASEKEMVKIASELKMRI